MKVEQLKWSHNHHWETVSERRGAKAQLVLYFTAQANNHPELYEGLRERFPTADIIGCSTGAQILAGEVGEAGAVATAIELSHTLIKTEVVGINNADESFHCGQQLATRLNAPDLRHVFILSDGLNVNGGALVEGFFSVLSSDVIVTGGLAGDSAKFVKTLVGFNGPAKDRQIVAAGFYGDHIQISTGCGGGWETFGPQRCITRSTGNILFELDGKPALDLYKEYLGDEVDNLPGSALLFPLAIHPADKPEQAMVRTILAIDENQKSMTFAGDIPQGHIATLMHASYNDLVDGAEAAAQQAASASGHEDSLAIMVSCIGRKLLLGQNISDEIEAVTGALGPLATNIGFYSYGEISHSPITQQCALFNQTMTVTVLHEKI